MSDEDRARLDDLVDYFGGGNRSAYLRATLKIMESIRRPRFCATYKPAATSGLLNRAYRQLTWVT